jgi:hypothetical protein
VGHRRSSPWFEPLASLKLGGGVPPEIARGEMLCDPFPHIFQISAIFFGGSMTVSAVVTHTPALVPMLPHEPTSGLREYFFRI